MAERGPSIEELAGRAGVSVRTVRYYISQGLLPGPANRGKYASYDDDHLARLQLIRRLADEHVPLAELRERLAHLSSEELKALLRQEERHSRALDQARAERSPRDHVSRLLARGRTRPAVPSWQAPADYQRAPAQHLPSPAAALLAVAQPEPVQRWELAPGVELYARADSAQQYAQLIERLLESARDELGRDSG